MSKTMTKLGQVGGTKFPRRRLLAGAAMAALVVGRSARASQSPGVRPSKVRLGQTVPLSGPASAFGTVSRVQQAYFAMVNARRGVANRAVELVSLDDAFNPAKTVEQTRRLVEHEQVFALFSALGPGTVAVRKYVNARRVPYVLVGDGSEAWDSPDSPWTTAFLPSFAGEGRAFAQHILQNHPNARIAVLAERGPLGDEGLAGLREALAAAGAPPPPAVQTSELTDPTVDSQVIALQGSGADVLVTWASPRAASQVLRRLGATSWRPQHYLTFVSSSVQGVMSQAGGTHAVGTRTTAFLKQPDDPRWSDDPGAAGYLAFMREFYPDGDPWDSVNVYGYSVAQTMDHLLRRCGAELTRKRLMQASLSLRDVELPMLLPGVRLSTDARNRRPIRRLEVVSFDGVRWR